MARVTLPRAPDARDRGDRLRSGPQDRAAPAAHSFSAGSIAECEASLEIDPRSAATLRALARALLAASRPVEAFQRADAALSLDRNDAEAWVLVGDALEQLEEPAIAVQAFGQALALGLDTAAVNLKAARLCQQLHDPHAAAARYARARGGGRRAKGNRDSD